MSNGTVFGIVANKDQWDGYNFERQRILNWIYGMDIKNTVILTGDIHTSWANDVPNPTMGDYGSNGQGSGTVEFVTSRNLEFVMKEYNDIRNRENVGSYSGNEKLLNLFTDLVVRKNHILSFEPVMFNRYSLVVCTDLFSNELEMVRRLNPDAIFWKVSQ